MCECELVPSCVEVVVVFGLAAVHDHEAREGAGRGRELSKV